MEIGYWNGDKGNKKPASAFLAEAGFYIHTDNALQSLPKEAFNQRDAKA